MPLSQERERVTLVKFKYLEGEYFILNEEEENDPMTVFKKLKPQWQLEISEEDHVKIPTFRRIKESEIVKNTDDEVIIRTWTTLEETQAFKKLLKLFKKGRCGND